MTSISTNVEVITPVMANALLNGMRRNRQCRLMRVEQIATAMRTGSYNGLNGETVVIDEDGCLIDGQHRMKAIIAANMPVKMLVARGVSAAAQDTIDQGLARTSGDVLGMHGHTAGHVLAAAARWLWIYENDWPGGLRSRGAAKVTTPLVLKIVKQHPQLEIAVSDVCGKYNKAARLMTVSIAAFTRLATDGVSSHDSDEFFDVLNSGEGSARTKAVRLLRDKLFARTSKAGRLVGQEIVALTIRAWNAMREGREITRLHIARDMDDPYVNVPRFE